MEHDPEAIWKTQLATTKALRKAKLTAKQIAAIGITNQRETTLLWDRETGRPIHHAIVWQDRRTAKDCDRLKTAATPQPSAAKRVSSSTLIFPPPKLRGCSSM